MKKRVKLTVIGYMPVWYRVNFIKDGQPVMWYQEYAMLIRYSELAAIEAFLEENQTESNKMYLKDLIDRGIIYAAPIYARRANKKHYSEQKFLKRGER